MRKRFSFSFLLTSLFCSVGLSFTAIPLNAQTVQIGTGTTLPTNTLYGPVYRFSATSTTTGARSNILYTAAEMSAAGVPAGAVISQVEFFKGNTANFTTPATYTMLMANTSNTSLATTLTWASVLTTHTQVYTNNSFNLPGTTGWVTWVLSVPFVYTGGALEIATEHTMGGNGGATANILWQYSGTSGSSASLIVGATTTGTLPATLNGTVADYKNRPNIKITYSSNACTSPPTPGTSTVTPAGPVCLGVPVDFNLTGHSSGSGQTYQWESSANLAGPYTPISGVLSSPGFNYNNVTATAYYRCAVTCTGNTQYSTPVQLALSPPLPAGTYTINSLQATGGTNYQTFAAAVSALSCGIAGPIVFNVDPASGPYNTQVIIPPIPGASAVNTVTFNGNGRVISDNSTATTTERAVIKLNGADHITFDNFVINTGGAGFGFGVQMLNDADNNTISNCIINNNTASTSTVNYAGIVINSTPSAITTLGASLCDDNTITGNTITGGYAGVAIVANGTTSMVQNNKITNNLIKEFYEYGIYINGNNNSLIEGNDITRPTRTAVTNFRGIGLSGVSLNTLISKNKLHNPFGGAPASTAAAFNIYFTACDATVGNENIVSNNIIYDHIGSTGNRNGILNASSDNVKYYYNTIFLNDVAATCTGCAARGIYVQTAPVTGLEFKNNIVSIIQGGTADKQCIYFEGTGNVTFTSNNNVFHMGSTAGAVNNIGFNNGTQYPTLAGWQSATTQDALSLSIDPVFLGAASGNLAPSSPAINNIGLPVAGITTDITNATRDAATPDPGAYEFTIAGCVAPPTPGTATVNNTPVCQNSSITLGLTGNSIGVGQTYQWESATAVGGPYTPVSGLLVSPGFSVTVGGATTYYRCAVTCTGNTQFSVPVEVIVIPGLSGNYTINSTAGPSATNFVSFTAALNALSCGITGAVVFDVDPNSGPYNEQLIITSVAGASATKTVTFNGNGRTLSFLSTNTNERAVIKLNGANHIIFNNLVINATGTTTTEYGYGIHFTNDADSNTINNCTININTTSTSTTNYAGIVMSISATSPIGTGAPQCDNNTFSNNTITGGYYGMTIVGNTTVANFGNKIINNTIRDFYFTGIYVNGSGATLIEGNNISRPSRTSVSTFNGIYFTSLSVLANVTRNRIHNPFGGDPASVSDFYGIYFTGVDALSNIVNTVSNNLIYNVNGAGDQYGLYNIGSDNVRYYHNTISLDGTGTGSTSSDFTRGFHQSTAAAGIILRNNIITINRGGPSQKTALYFGTAITAANVIESNRNDLFLFSGTGTEDVGFINGSAYGSLADWKAASGQDANSVSTNPIYANTAVGDFKPVNASIDNRGLPQNILVDINNDPRSTTTPDLGAYEFTPAICTTPPVAGTSAVSTTPVCVNSPVQLSLVGNSYGLTQTYQWQTATSIAGPYTNVGNLLSNPDTTITSSSTFYYRVAVTCSGNTEFSSPILLTVTPALPAGTYTIDQTSPPSATNFISFNAAKDALECGIEGPVVINVEPGSGPYVEQLILDSIPGTSPTKTITFNGNGEEIQFTSTNTNERAVIKLHRTDYVTFNGLWIAAQGTSTTEYGFAVQMINNADFNTISNCVININTSSTSTTNYAGIVINSSHTGITTTGDSKCDNNTISGNTITGGYAGVAVVANSATNQTLNNTIVNNTIRDFYTYGIYVNGTRNMLVENNNISRPVRTNSGTSGYAIYFNAISTNAKISKNRIHNLYGGMAGTSNDAYGIYLTTCDATAGNENVISNNAIYNMTGDGIVYGMYNTGSDYARYYHNTISLDNTASVTTEVTRGLFQTTAADGIQYKNNIVTISRGGTGTKHAIYLATATTTYTSDYNNFYIDPATSNAFIGFSGADQATLANWQSVNPTQDQNSLSLDPLYTNMTAGNLKPNFAPLDNEGTPVNIITDILSAPRSISTPDIGAWEFAVQPCVAPPTPGISTAVPDAGMCLGTPVQLSLTGSSQGAAQTYQWQFSTSATGPWTDLGTVMLIPDTIINASGIFYYRAAVTCGGNTQFSVPVFVNTNPPFPGGLYTINNTIPTDYPTGSNFNSFVEAVAAMDCGISGAVIFDVVPGTYTEQVRMHAIAGTSSINTVTFRSQNGNSASVVLTFDMTSTPANYVLQLDSASHIIYRNMTITATGTSSGRAIEIARTASHDSLLNLVITVPVSTSTSNNVAGIVGTALTGTSNVIKGNIISNGSSGIYISGTSAALPADRLLIDSNTIHSSYYYNIYTSNTKRVKVSNNVVSVTSPRNSTAYGIYGTASDTAYEYVGNKVTMNGITSATSHGIYLTGCDATTIEPGRVANNKIDALVGNTGVIYGLNQATNTNNSTVNNVIVINTSGASSYGLYSSAGGIVKYYNNSVNNLSNSVTNNYAAYFANTSGNGVDVRNNIFSHMSGGRAMFVGSIDYMYSDYNMLYTNGTTLIQSGTPAAIYTTLAAWRTASSLDPNSIVYQPAFNSATNLTPNLGHPDVWAIHGRGVQIAGNNYDYNNNTRPVTLVAGVPDLGAYEFVPTSTPPVLPATPAAPAAGITQTFMFGTDTVSKITWKPASNVPATVSVRRYSGVTPPGMAATDKYMYFYTDVDASSSGTPNYELKQFYIDPWQGLVPRETSARLGRTNAAGVWIMDSVSTVDSVQNYLRRDTLNFIDKFTGMTDSTIRSAPPPPYVIPIDTSNAGTRFWVAYGHHYQFSTNDQTMVLYLSAEQAARVQVRVNGTGWVRNYNIPANTVIVSDALPKTGLSDSRLLDEGLSEKGISITSDVPIVPYAHIYYNANSGASMLMPVGVYGYEYVSLNSKQYYPTGGAGSYSWFYVIADRDSTLVEITPSVATKGGRPANVPFTVYLNRGQVYNVMGTINGATGTELTGSRIRSVPNASGKCFPIAVFSGSSRTALCNTTNGDNMIQQVFPSQAWGKRYLTSPTANTSSNTAYNANIWRVMVKDPATVVKRNGTPLTGLITPGNFYEFSVAAGDGLTGSSYIEADKPVMVAQYMISTGGTGCPGITGQASGGDPEMIYISPIEQGIKRAVFYNTDQFNIDANYVNVIIPTPGLASLRIDGSATFTHVFAHPNLVGYSCVRHNLGSTVGQHTIQSDFAFNIITYGLGNVESYGYNAGTLVNNLNALGNISNVLASAAVSPYTCKGSPFRMRIRLSVKPTQIVWHLGQQVPGLPNVDSVQNAPVPVDSIMVNGNWQYYYVLNQDYTITTTGTFTIPVTIVHPDIEGCNSSLDFTVNITVIPEPVTDFSVIFPGCVNSIAQFNGSSVPSTVGVAVNNWSWDFGDATNSNIEDPSKQWAAAGVYNVRLRAIADDGCVGEVTKPVAVGLPPVINITPDSLAACNGSNVSFAVQNAVAGGVYNWYTTTGTLVHTGVSYSFTVTGPVTYLVEATDPSGCVSVSLKRVVVTILPVLATPVAVVDSAGTNMVRFRWNAVPNATSYQVSINSGGTWITPSSGPNGLIHIVTGLQVGQSATLIVRALGGCLPAESLPVTGTAVTDQVYIPNTFTPNNDGMNDQLRVYSNVIRDMHMMIFNQWGEKIFESRTQSVAWDGTHNGKPQPSGVYMYVCDITLTNGTRIQRKGSINLVR